MRGLLIGTLVLAAGAGAAQANPPDAQPSARPREEIFRMVDAYIANNLQETLGLSDDQLARALPLVRRLHADRRRFAERRFRTLRQMRLLAHSGSVTDARGSELVQELKAAEAEEAAGIRAGQEALDAVLTPSQQVKYRILEAEVEHRLRDVMARVRAERRNAPGHPRRDGPGDPPNDVP